ncbi:MAG: ATP-binding cassette domain-containing protein [Eggerthellaceae bacterium]|nr:ATP-binding cassette domain-containing protein [Eggerthellaceae bacterium]MCH4220397.1 ATP-binding cassette domain-containing protein [Eggerthellaceae bacterium]
MLEIKNLVFEVPVKEGSKKTKRIIDNISLNIEDNCLNVITGPNGGGKSTLAKLIMGIEQPTSGQIVFNGVDITHMGCSDRAKMGIGYAFQQPPRFKGIRVKKLLEIAAGKRLPMFTCNQYLSQVGLCSASYLNREVDKSLSGGEIKRIEIATILARNPQLALYDEPEAGIDLWSFDRLTETFKAIHEKRDNHSIVIISHQERIINLADQIILLKDGHIEDQGTAQEIIPKLDMTMKKMRAEQNPACSFSEPTDIAVGQINTNC